MHGGRSIWQQKFIEINILLIKENLRIDLWKLGLFSWKQVLVSNSKIVSYQKEASGGGECAPRWPCTHGAREEEKVERVLGNPMKIFITYHKFLPLLLSGVGPILCIPRSWLCCNCTWLGRPSFLPLKTPPTSYFPFFYLLPIHSSLWEDFWSYRHDWDNPESWAASLTER